MRHVSLFFAIAPVLSASAAQPYDALEIGPAEVALTAEGFDVVTDVTTDGIDALGHGLSGDGEANLAFVPQVTGVLGFSTITRWENGMNASVQRWDGSAWVRFAPALTLPDEWTLSKIWVQEGGTYRFHFDTGGFVEPNYAGLDALSLEPLQAPDLSAFFTGLDLANDGPGLWVPREGGNLGAAMAPDPALGQVAVLHGTVSGPAYLKLSLFTNYQGYVMAMLDGDLVLWANETGWEAVFLAAPAGEHTFDLRGEFFGPDAVAVSNIALVPVTSEGLAGAADSTLDLVPVSGLWFAQSETVHSGGTALQGIFMDELPALRSTVVGPVVIDFQTRGAPGERYPQLVTRIDDEWSARMRNSANSWLGQRIYVPAGTHTVEWTQQSASSIYLDAIEAQPAVEGDLAAAADSPIALANVGDGFWRYETSTALTGGAALESLSMDGQPAVLRGTVTGPSVVTYQSNARDADNGGPLDVWLDSSFVTRTWRPYWQAGTVFVPAGTHTIEWRAENYYGSPSYLDTIAVTPLEGGAAADALDTDDLTFIEPPDDWVVAGPNQSYDGVDAYAKSRAEDDPNAWPDHDPASLVAVVAGPAKVSFMATAAGAASVFEIAPANGGDEDFAKVSEFRDIGWNPEAVLLPAGVHYLRWGFGGREGYSSLRLDTVSVQTLESASLATALDAPELHWQTLGDGEWTGIAYGGAEGGYAAISPLFTGGGYADMVTTVDGPGTLSFRIKPQVEGSAAAGGSELRVYRGTLKADGNVDSVLMFGGPTSGWVDRSFEIPAGRTYIEFQAVRLPGSEESHDGARLWLVDKVAFAPSPADTALRASVPAGDDWMWSPWLGSYWDGFYPWIYSTDLGWEYVVGAGDDSVWLYDESWQTWFWTSEGTYRWVYDCADDEWYFHPYTGDGSRLFWRASDGQTIVDEAPPSAI